MLHPDCWVIIKISKPDEILYKLLSGRSFNWRMNSGITEVKEFDKHYEISGYSGTTYKCDKGSETLNPATAGIFTELVAGYGDVLVKKVGIAEVIKALGEVPSGE